MNALIIGGNGYVGQGISKVLERNSIEIIKTSRSRKLDKNTRIFDINKNYKNIDCSFISELPESYFNIVIMAGGFTTYINNSNMGDISNEIIDKIIQSNFLSTYRLLSLIQSNLTFSSTCKVIIISSTAGIYARGSNVIYSAMKSGVNSLIKSSNQWMRDGQKVLGLCPGLLAGGMTKNAPIEYINYWKSIYPLGKLVTAEDVGKKILDLIFDEDLESGYISELK